jgi:hypothetical protein
MATNHDRRLSRLEEHRQSETPRIRWLRGETRAEIDSCMEKLIALGQAKATDLFVRWQI